MKNVSREIQIRHISNCLKADSAYGAGIAKELGIPLNEVPGWVIIRLIAFV